MGGQIRVESAVGHGSTFHFTARFGLQRHLAQRRDTTARDTLSQQEKRAVLSTQLPLARLRRRRAEPFPTRRQRYRILLAEDNPVNQKILLRLLEKHGYTVTMANNGRKALAMLEQEQFDLALMDVQMPELDGLTVTTAIRQREQQTGVHLPIIAMTAHAMDGDRERCVEAGMDGYVSKPFRAADLFAAIEQLIPPQRQD